MRPAECCQPATIVTCGCDTGSDPRRVRDSGIFPGREFNQPCELRGLQSAGGTAARLLLLLCCSLQPDLPS